MKTVTTICHFGSGKLSPAAKLQDLSSRSPYRRQETRQDRLANAQKSVSSGRKRHPSVSELPDW